MTSKTIWKYPLRLVGEQAIQMPKGAEILCAQVQGEGAICVWALVDPKVEKEERMIVIYGTGHPVTDLHCKYIGTVQMDGGSLIWHVFELK